MREGDVRAAKSVAPQILTGLAVAVVAALVAFLAWGRYARKETVSGALAPQPGLVLVSGGAAGVFSEGFAAEGWRVAQGEPLFSIARPQVLEGGVRAEQGVLLLLRADLERVRA